MTDETLSRLDAASDPNTASDPTLSAAARPAVEWSDGLIGSVLDGRYRIDALLGRGGMGAVYRAQELGVTERAVAIKVILPGGQDAQKRADRFRREARAAARLAHPHSLRVFSFGETEAGDLYLATELLRGCSLGDELQRVGRLPPERALRIAVQACAALSEAHGAGMLHRDLKPDNLFLVDASGTEEFVKVIDFGLASLPEAHEPRLTDTGAVLGTPAYMSPEQVQGLPLGPETDVYAMGIILYEMLTGRRPFAGPTPFEVMRAQAMDAPPALEVTGQQIPAPLVGVVDRCLAKQAAARYADAEALRVELQRILTAAEPHALALAQPEWVDAETDDEGLESLGPPDSLTDSLTDSVLRRPRRRALIAVGVALSALLVGLAWWAQQQPDAPANTRVESATEGDSRSAPAPVQPAVANALDPEAASVPEPRPAAVASSTVVARRSGGGEAPRRAARELVAATAVNVSSQPPRASLRLWGQDRGRAPQTLFVPQDAAWALEARLPGRGIGRVVVKATGGDIRVDLPAAKPSTPKPDELDVRKFDQDERVLKQLEGK